MTVLSTVGTNDSAYAADKEHQLCEPDQGFPCRSSQAGFSLGPQPPALIGHMLCRCSGQGPLLSPTVLCTNSSTVRLRDALPATSLCCLNQSVTGLYKYRTIRHSHLLLVQGESTTTVLKVCQTCVKLHTVSILWPSDSISRKFMNVNLSKRCSYL